MYLNASTDKLEIVLSGAVATNQLQWNVSWQDITSAGMTLPQSAGAGNTNNTTAVQIVGSPAASTTRQVTSINIYNADTATSTVIVRKDVSGSKYVLVKYAVTSGDTLMWSREYGWRLLSVSGGGGGGVTQIVAGSNITISPAGGTGAVTINSTGGGTGGYEQTFLLMGG
jgi:hypothetical protein